MKHVLIVMALSISAACQIGWGGIPASKFAQVLADCPTETSGYFLCPVVPADGSQPYMAMSVAGFNGGAPFAIVSPGQNGQNGQNGSMGPQGPPGQSMPKSFTLICGASQGSIPKGFTAKCSWQ